MARPWLLATITLVLLRSALPAQSDKPLSDFQILSPRGGETWSAGSKHLLRWKARTTPSKQIFKIEYTTDEGTTWHLISGSAPDTGSVLWEIPARVTPRCKIRFTPSSGGDGVQSSVFSLIPSQEVRDYAWTQVTARAAFAPRDGAGALTYKGKLWLLGGWNPGDKKHFPRICNNEVWSSTNGAVWTLEKPNTFLDRTFDPMRDWEGRHTAGYVVHRDRLWIVGGDVNQGHYHSDVWNSEDGRTWTLVNRNRPVPWGPRALHYTVAHADRIWVLGGQTVPNFARADEVFYRDIWNSPDGVTWERVVPREPYWSTRGMIGGSAVFRGRIWILGGGTYDTPKVPTRNFYNDVWSSADGVRWERHLEAAPWAARQYHEVAAYDDRLWVLEGYSGTNRNDVWYSADGVNWYEVPKTPWKPRHAASVFVHDGALWMVAGNNMESDVWTLRRRSRIEK